MEKETILYIAIGLFVVSIGLGIVLGFVASAATGEDLCGTNTTWSSTSEMCESKTCTEGKDFCSNTTNWSTANSKCEGIPCTDMTKLECESKYDLLNEDDCKSEFDLINETKEACDEKFPPPDNVFSQCDVDLAACEAKYSSNYCEATHISNCYDYGVDTEVYNNSSCSEKLSVCNADWQACDTGSPTNYCTPASIKNKIKNKNSIFYGEYKTLSSTYL